ncbi:MAG: ribose 1,5-bisphosphate isomerase [Euryarchaeota archaeon]|nr:ribose 1,5-bisphosphate isomerase [Euryarchaeota archaeon]
MLIDETAEKIRTMEIRGAGLIARSAVIALKEYGNLIETSSCDVFLSEMNCASEKLLKTRPTAVSLPNAVHFVMKPLKSMVSVKEGKQIISERTDAFVRRSEDAVRQIGIIGARHISDGDVVMTHCNSQVALACIIEAKQSGKDIEVFATEVRPRNQGLLTIKALNEAGIKTNYIVDSAARYFMNDVDLVIVGTDAVTVNGAVVNKIGTSQIALAAHEARTRFVVAAETYKFAPRTVLGDRIEIEERPTDEVLSDDIAAGFPNVRIRNPSFDVTPASYIDLIVTEMGAIPPVMAYTVIRDYLGWEIDEFKKIFKINHRDQE